MYFKCLKILQIELHYDQLSAPPLPRSTLRLSLLETRKRSPNNHRLPNPLRKPALNTRTQRDPKRHHLAHRAGAMFYQRPDFNVPDLHRGKLLHPLHVHATPGPAAAHTPLPAHPLHDGERLLGDGHHVIPAVVSRPARHDRQLEVAQTHRVLGAQVLAQGGPLCAVELLDIR